MRRPSAAASCWYVLHDGLVLGPNALGPPDVTGADGLCAAGCSWLTNSPADFAIRRHVVTANSHGQVECSRIPAAAVPAHHVLDFRSAATP